MAKKKAKKVSKVSIPMKEAREIHSAIARAEAFFRSRDKMNSHIHLDLPVFSPITVKMGKALSLIAKHAYPDKG
jgi:hypothetical protein